MKRYLLLYLCLFCGFWLSSLAAQKDERLAQGLPPLGAVALLRMPSQDNAALLQEELARRGPGIAPRFAVNLPVDVTPADAGTWHRGQQGMMVWRLRIQSPGAHSLNLGFSQFLMPDGAQLLLYTADYKEVRGPFTPADNEDHEQLWTPLLMGDELVIELQIPEVAMQALRLKLSFVNHAFEDLQAIISGSCNLDVICDETNGWGVVNQYRDIIQSVAVISTGGSTFCTGFLVNNTAQDCRPFFMTANHCGVTAGVAPSLVTYWNYQNSTCRQPNSPASGQAGNGQLDDFNTGAIFRASSTNSDFTLLELDDPVSITANAFFAGWDATGSAVSSAVGIHHPRGEEKRISFDFDPLQFTLYGGTSPSANFTHVRVLDWNIGTTEPGSSGSPLFNQQGRVLGQLHGGGAACGNDLSDYYGSFAVSWNGGGTNSTRLRNWLDPANSGVLTLDGKYQSACTATVLATPESATICQPQAATYSVQVSSGFSSSATLSLSGHPAGSTFTFSPANVAPGGTSTLTVQTAGAAPGVYVLMITATGGGQSASVTAELTVLNGTGSAPVLQSPVNNANNVIPNPSLNWLADGSGQTTYDVQIALNPQFTNILEQGSVNDGNFSPQEAGMALTRYYWRVRARNACGTGAYSAPFSFVVGNYTCEVFASSPALNITEVGTSTLEDAIFIAEDHSIEEIRIGLEVAHTYVGDLSARLLTPLGANISLFDRPGFPQSSFGCSQDNLKLEFRSNGTASSILESTCNTSETGSMVPGPPYAVEGIFQPVGSFAGLLNQAANGLWTLELNDNAAADGGQWLTWNVTVCYASNAAPPTLLTNATLNVMRGSSATITNQFLLADDAIGQPASLIFTVRRLPTQGILSRNGQALAIGNAFTQADINAGLLRYQHSGGIVLSDNFEFDLSNASGATLSGNVFNINITVGALQPSLEQTQSILCFGASQAALRVVVMGGLPPYQYSLNGGAFQSVNTFSNLPAGNYTVQVRDALGSTATSVTLAVGQPPQLTASAVVDNNDVTIQASGGTTPYRYSINGGAGTQVPPTFLDLANGTYTFTVIDANNCTATTTATVAVNTLQIVTTVVRQPSCHNIVDGVVLAGVSGGAIPYMYSLNGATFQSSNTFFNLGAGTYSVTVRDAQGFERISNIVTLVAPAPLNVSTSISLNTVTLNATGGTPPYRYSRNSGQTTQSSPVFSNLPNGNYTFTVLDANNCSTNIGATIAVNTLAINLGIETPILCNGMQNGQILANASGGTPPLSYSLNDGPYQSSPLFSMLTPGTYRVRVRDSEGFERLSASLTLNEPPALTLTLLVNQSAISATALGGTPPYRYRLDNNPVTQTDTLFNNLSNGVHTVDVLDNNGCIATASAVVAVNTLVVQLSVTDSISCYGLSDGRLEVGVSGGLAPYLYSLDGENFQSSPLFFPLDTGVYTVTVRDAEGFLRTSNAVALSWPPLLQLSSDVVGDSIVAHASGGTPPLQFRLDTGLWQTDSLFANLDNGFYRLQVRDANGCSLSENLVLVQEVLMANVITIAPLLCRTDSLGSLLVMSQGGIFPYEFSLDGIHYQTLNIFDSLRYGFYAVWVRDALGTLFVTPPYLLDAPPALTVQLVVNGDGLIALPAGGTPPYRYWLNGELRPDSVYTALPPGEYQLLLEDANGCEATATADIMTGLAGLEAPFEAAVFPNPSTGMVTLWLHHEDSSPVQVTLYNALGQRCFMGNYLKPAGNWQQLLDWTALPVGVYVLAVELEQKRVTKRILLER